MGISDHSIHVRIYHVVWSRVWLIGGDSGHVQTGLESFSSSEMTSNFLQVDSLPTTHRSPYRGYSKLRTHTALGPFRRAMPRSIGPSQGRCVSFISSEPCRCSNGAGQQSTRQMRQRGAGRSRSTTNSKY